MTLAKKEKAKRYYKKLIADHQRTLAKMRMIIDHVLDHIAEDIYLDVAEDTLPNSPEKALETPLNNGGEESYVAEIKENSGAVKNNGIDYIKLHRSGHVIARIFPKKESLADVIARVGRIAIKIIPLEQQLARQDLTKLEVEELHEVAEHLYQHDTEEDMEVIEDYIQRYNKQHGYVKLDELESKGWTKPKDPHDIPMPYVLVEE